MCAHSRKGIGLDENQSTCGRMRFLPESCLHRSASRRMLSGKTWPASATVISAARQVRDTRCHESRFRVPKKLPGQEHSGVGCSRFSRQIFGEISFRMRGCIIIFHEGSQYGECLMYLPFSECSAASCKFGSPRVRQRSRKSWTAS